MTTLVAPKAAEAHRSVLNVAARCGLVARGLVYLLLGWLALDIARGRSGQQANQKGAIAQLAQQRDGTALLIALAAGLAGYALWRFSQAAFGSRSEGRAVGPRLKALGRALVYAALCAVAIGFLSGSSGPGQAQQQEDLTRSLLRHTGGRWAVGAVAVVVIVIGGYLAFDGVRRGFARDLETHRMSSTTRHVVIALGVVGSVARGLVIMLAGGLTVVAAVTADPAKSTGLDGAMRTLAHQPAGPWLLGAVAAGLAAFGLFGLAAAAWARI